MVTKAVTPPTPHPSQKLPEETTTYDTLAERCRVILACAIQLLALENIICRHANTWHSVRLA
jgi:hypothetical protein